MLEARVQHINHKLYTQMHYFLVKAPLTIVWLNWVCWSSLETSSYQLSSYGDLDASSSVFFRIDWLPIEVQK